MAFGDTTQSKTATAGASSLDITLDSTPTEGNLLVAHYSLAQDTRTINSGPTGFTAFSGWVELDNGNHESAAYWRIVESGDDATIDGFALSGGSNIAATVIEIEGPFATSPLDQLTTNDNSDDGLNVTSIATGNITTTEADEVLITGLSVDGNRSGLSYTNSFTEVAGVNGTGCSSSLAKRVVTSTGTYSTTASWTAANPATIGLASFEKEAGGLVGGAAFQPALNFPTGSIDLTVTGGAAFPPTISFPTGTISTDGGPQTLVGGAAFQPGLTFPLGTVSPGAITLTGAVFAPSPTFPQGQVNLAATGAVFAPSLSFPTGTLQAGTVTLVGGVLAPTLSFPTGVLQTAPSGTRQDGGITSGLQDSGLSVGRQS